MSRVLVVGAGFAGAVYARELADAGYEVDVIDKRSHIAGNCYDYVHSSGVRIHHYGPHLFHTSNMRVVEWLNKFTEWVPYDHCVVARLPDGRLVPAPVNLDTVNSVFGVELETPEQVAEFLSTRVIARDPITSAEDHLYSKIGPDLTDLFFRPYTQKMWELDLSEVDASVVQRLQIRTDRENRYFPSDTFQAMPKEGYTKIFERIFDHPKISVRLNTEFDVGMLDAYDACFNSMPIDEFFGFEFGELPYRSIRFHLTEVPKTEAPDHVVINYTDTSPYTRETWWHLIPAHLVSDTGTVLRTVEEPCNYKDNNLERYYPVKTSDGRFEAIYKRYQEKAAENDRLVFIGRCGTYQYLDMHQVINQSLANVGKWIEGHR